MTDAKDRKGSTAEEFLLHTLGWPEPQTFTAIASVEAISIQADRGPPS